MSLYASACAHGSPSVDQPSFPSGIFHTPRGLLHPHLIHPTPSPPTTGYKKEQKATQKKKSFCSLVLNVCKHGAPLPSLRTIVPRWAFLLLTPSHLAYGKQARRCWGWDGGSWELREQRLCTLVTVPILSAQGLVTSTFSDCTVHMIWVASLRHRSSDRFILGQAVTERRVPCCSRGDSSWPTQIAHRRSLQDQAKTRIRK